MMYFFAILHMCDWELTIFLKPCIKLTMTRNVYNSELLSTYKIVTLKIYLSEKKREKEGECER